MMTIEYNGTRCSLLQQCVVGKMVHHLNFVGLEVAANKIKSRLTNGNYRNSPDECKVRLHTDTTYCNIALDYAKYVTDVATIPGDVKGTTYLNITLTHPLLMPNPRESGATKFKLLSLTDDDTMPPHFFDWLKTKLDCPLDPAWAGWLWEDGLNKGGKYTSINKVGNKVTYNNGHRPITSLGGVGCRLYEVDVSPTGIEAWLEIIRSHFGIQPETLRLQGAGGFHSPSFLVKQDGKVWGFFHNDEPDKPKFTGDSFGELFLKARQAEGYNIHFSSDAPKPDYGAGSLATTPKTKQPNKAAFDIWAGSRALRPSNMN